MQDEGGQAGSDTSNDSPVPPETTLRADLLDHCRTCREAMEDDLRDVLAQINSALTRTYTTQYAIIELARKGIERLTEMEKDLGMDKEQLVLPLMPDQPDQILWPDRRDLGMVAKDLEKMKGDEAGQQEDLTIKSNGARFFLDTHHDFR